MKTYFFSILEQIDYGIVPGLSSEIRDCLKYDERVLSSQVDIIDKMEYLVTIKLVNYNLQCAKSVFSSLIQFIQYSSVFYIREDNEQNIRFLLLSKSDGFTGFFCSVIFEDGSNR